MLETKKEVTLWWVLFACWIMACSAVLGSLFFSEIMEFAPCTLCWYQRIFIYPLVILLPIGMFPVDLNVLKYVLPLTAIGWVIAFYHNLLYYKFLPESSSPCAKGVSCTDVFFDWFGFIDIPLLSLLTFSIMMALLIFAKRRFS